MNIAVVGTGYVGLVAGVCFADAGHNVFCIDNNRQKIDLLLDGKIPIYEPGLTDLMARSKSRLHFSTDLQEGTDNCNVVFVAVGTPETEDGSADMGPTYSVVEEVCRLANKPTFIVLKSTVPVGTAKTLRQRYTEKATVPVEIVSNPEFLKEGAAIEDFLRPDRVVIGCRTPEAEAIMNEVYEPFLRNGNPIYFMDNTSAEMTKYAANAFLAVKISFINELSLLADQMGADINHVRTGFTTDRRIDPAFFYPGIGFGGSCFPKDIKALVHVGEQNGVGMQVVKAADEVNFRQKILFYDRIKTHFGHVKDLTLAFWGLSFKPQTDDVREAPALYLIHKLTEEGATIKAYDPVANDNASQASPVPFSTEPNAYDALEGADALMICTEWNEFKSPDFDKIKARLKKPIIFDGRNIYDPKKMKKLGFTYYCVGRQNMEDRING